MHLTRIGCYRKSILPIVIALFFAGAFVASANGAKETTTSSQAETQSITAFMAVHHYTTALKTMIPTFEKATGISVTLNELPEEEFFKKTTIELSSGKPSFDVFFLNQGFVPQYAQAGWLEPLQKYIDDPSLTNKTEYDFADFPPASLVRPTFQGTLYGIPASVEPQIMFYRKDILEQLKIPVPKTMDELYAAAVRIKKEVPGVAGIALRLRRGAGSYWPWLGVVSDYRGQWVDQNNKVHMTSPETKAATAMYIKLIKDAGPDAPLNYGWYECLTSFQQGKAAFLLDANSWEAAFQDPSKSKVVGKVGAAHIPAGPDGYIQAAGGSSWMLGIPSQSQKKTAAWKFVEWASSKPVTLQVAIKGGDITRSSTWTDPTFTKAYPYPDWIEASSSTTSKYNNTYYLPSTPKLGAMGEIIDVTLQNIFIGNPLDDELQKAQKQTEDLLTQ